MAFRAFSGRNLAITGAAAVLAACAAVPFAVADDSAGPSGAGAAAADVPPVAVETFDYPGAADILATQGIKLKKGDGHVLLAECDAAPDQIKVMTVADAAVGRKGTYCFQANAKSGFVTLELPRVFALETGAHPISADLTANGATTTVDVAKGGFESVGEGVPGGAQSVLVEIRVTG